MTVIEVKDLSFSYGQSPIISDISFKIEGPGLYCILGPNGVGKSTLIKCINKINKPDAGTVTIDGNDVSAMTSKELSKVVGYVPVGGNDLFSMPVIDAVLIGRYTQQKWKTTGEDLEVVRRTMKLLGISSLSMHGCNELSAGQHQMVAMARGIVQETPVLLLDEPTANLDVRYQVYIAALLKGMTKAMDLTVIMISHDLNIAAKYADGIIMMAAPGRIHSMGPPEEVITEETINEVYGVSCEIIRDSKGKPHVILDSALWMDDRGDRMDDRRLEEIGDYWTQRSEGFSDHMLEHMEEDMKGLYVRRIKEYSDTRKMKVLDIGTGPGLFPIILGKDGHDVTAIDYSDGMLEMARRNCLDAGVSPALLKMDAQHLGFEDETFDLIVSRKVLWNLPDPEGAYKEWLRVLKPEGRMILFDANWWLHFYDEEYKNMQEKRMEEFKKAHEGESVPEPGGDYPHTYQGADPRILWNFAKDLPLSRCRRPSWDVQALTELGVRRISVDVDRSSIADGGKVLVDSFVITVVKERSAWAKKI